MLQRKNRFFGPGATRVVQRTGKAARTDMFSVRYITNPNSGSSKFAVVVSKKVDKRAVVRNKIRRRVYGWLERNWHMIHHPALVTIAVFDVAAADTPYKDFDKEMTRLFSRANLFNDSKNA